MNLFLFVCLCFCRFECSETANNSNFETYDNILLQADTPQMFQVFLHHIPIEEQPELLENYLLAKFDDDNTFELDHYSPQIECIKVALHVLIDISSLDNIFDDFAYAVPVFIGTGNINMAKTWFSLGFKYSDLRCVPPIIKQNRFDMILLLGSNGLGITTVSIFILDMIESNEITPMALDYLFTNNLILLEIPQKAVKGWLERTVENGSFDLAHVAYRHGVRFPGNSVEISIARRESLCGLAARFAEYLNRWEAYKRAYVLKMALEDANTTLFGIPFDIMQNNICLWMLNFDDLVSPSDLYQQS